MLAPPKPKVNPALAWLLVFLPALAYFLSTRLSSGFWSELGETVHSDLLLRLGKESSEACLKLSETFYLSSSACSTSKSSRDTAVTSADLKYALQLVQTAGLQGVVDLLWRHDSEIGRGYLLLSESAGKGRIWRWEVGGGPIAIGKTLHLENSGCRSGTYKNCDSGDSTGSGAMAVDFHRAGTPASHAAEGLLVVAEWGEGRIVRLEENGARTPLLMHAPCFTCDADREESESVAATVCSDSIPNPERMLFTPTGDLIVVVNYQKAHECSMTDSASEHTAVSAASALIQLPHAVHVTPLASLQESRLAHSWTDVQHNLTAHILYADPSVSRIGGIAVTPTTIYFTAKRRGENESSSIVVMAISIEEDNSDDDIEEIQDEAQTQKEDKVAIDLAEYAPGSQQPGALAVSHGGRFFVTVQDGVLILDPTLGVLGKLAVPAPTAVALGGDGYLYVASSSRLYRIRTKEKPVELPTNRIARLKKPTTK